MQSKPKSFASRSSKKITGSRSVQSQSRSKSAAKRPKGNFQSLGSLFDHYQLTDKGGYITQEFQDYGYRLAAELNDLVHKSLYIKLAKETDRRLLEQARTFVIDADQARSKAKLFMWKLKQLKADQK